MKINIKRYNYELITAIATGELEKVQAVYTKIDAAIAQSDLKDNADDFIAEISNYVSADKQNPRSENGTVPFPYEKKLTDTEGCSPLHVAVKIGNYDIVELLIRKGANVNAVDATRKTPFYEAASRGELEIAKLLIINHANVNVTGPNGYTPLHNTITSERPYQAEFQELAKLLVEHNADVNKATDEGYTPLHIAANFCNVALTKLFLEKSANVNATCIIKLTPLHMAAQHGYLEIAKLLIKYGADVNQADSRRRTPLDIAKIYRHTELVKLLKKHIEKSNDRADTSNQCHM